LFLYELKEDQGRHDGPIVADCGIFCESWQTKGIKNEYNDWTDKIF
jgi:hypothetical protein